MTAPQQTPNQVPEWTLGWRLQRALAHAGISAEEMGESLGVTRSTVSRWMHDRGGPPRKIYVRHWAMRTGVSYEWLSGDDDINDEQETASRLNRGYVGSAARPFGSGQLAVVRAA